MLIPWLGPRATGRSLMDKECEYDQECDYSEVINGECECYNRKAEKEEERCPV